MYLNTDFFPRNTSFDKRAVNNYIYGFYPVGILYYSVVYKVSSKHDRITCGVYKYLLKYFTFNSVYNNNTTYNIIRYSYNTKLHVTVYVYIIMCVCVYLYVSKIYTCVKYTYLCGRLLLTWSS